MTNSIKAENSENTEQEFDFRVLFDKFAIHWRWFLLGVLIALSVAYVYLRYTAPQYNAATTILVKDEKKGGLASDLAAFSDLGIGGAKNNLDNEIEILKSRTLVESTVRKMKLAINLSVKGKVRSTPLYKNEPIRVSFLQQSKDFDNLSAQFEFAPLSASTFQLDELGEKKNLLSPKASYRYGEPIKSKHGIFVVLKVLGNAEFQKVVTDPIQIHIEAFENVVNNYRARLAVSSVSKTSSVVELSFTDPVLERAEDFLNQLVKNYNQEAASDKNFIAENTSRFIANRLALITEELDGVERNVQDFKNTNRLTDIETEAKLFIEGSSEYDKKGVEVDIQLNMIGSMLDFLKNSKKSDLLPNNIISGEATEMIEGYNKLVLDRNRILKSATETNPSVLKLDEQIQSLKTNVSASLLRMKSNLQIQKRDLAGQEGLMNSKIDKIPVQERQFRVIARQQKVKEELYLYLLQKREETAITLAVTEDIARVVDQAKGSDIAVAPKKGVIYLAALLLGLLVPFGVIYVNDLMDTKIKSRLDLEGRTSIPFIGDVPSSDSPNELMQAESRTSSAEALRIIRTNLEFLLTKVKEGQAKTIFLTSTFPSEGKTFVSVNLAATFALSGKKVLLIGMDIRSPRLDDYIDIPDRGVTNYLSSKSGDITDYIVRYDGFEHFDVLPAGLVPPNPAELLMSKKVDVLFETLKSQYDYIIVDTVPVALVTDTLLVAHHADCFIYVARAKVLQKRMLSIPNTLYNEQKLPNMCLLLNDTDSSKGYGYGYGYGVMLEKKSLFKRIFNLK
jgi:capsular exopolysaccharide synthesis family protein